MHIKHLTHIESHLSACARWGLALLLATLALGAWPVRVARAADITVTTTTDEINTNSQCSLREAIINANNDDTSGSTDCPAGSGDDVIYLSTNTYTLLNGELSIGGGDSLTINGAGIGSTIIDGNQNGRVLYVYPGVTVEINGVTIRNGHAYDGSGSGGHGSWGGGIYNAGTLTLNYSAVSDNVSGSGSDGSSGGGGYGGLGGGIYSLGTLTLNYSTISDNVTGYGGTGDGSWDGGYGGDGGGIYNAGTLTLINSTVSTNTTGYGGNGGGSGGYGGDGGYGGGIYNADTLTLTNSTVSSNTTGRGGDGGGGGGYGGDGGGIYNDGPLTLTDSTISNNVTGIGGGGDTPGSRGSGGGIYSTDSGSGTVESNTLDGNTARSGGGIYNSGTLTLTNSTISGNTSYYSGGGIYSSRGTLNLNHCTIAQNTADGDVDSSGDGGGIARSGGTVNVRNTIVAYNTDNSASPVNAPDCYDAFISLDYNLIGDTTGCSGFPAANDITNQAALLYTLADNGGSTWTHGLQTTSPALDAIPVISCTLTADQRGQTRPVDYNNDNPPARCDIGAFELQNGETPNAVTLRSLAIHPVGGVYAGALLPALGVVGVLLRRVRRRRRSTL